MAHRDVVEDVTRDVCGRRRKKNAPLHRTFDVPKRRPGPDVQDRFAEGFTFVGKSFVLCWPGKQGDGSLIIKEDKRCIQEIDWT